MQPLRSMSILFAATLCVAASATNDNTNSYNADRFNQAFARAIGSSIYTPHTGLEVDVWRGKRPLQAPLGQNNQSWFARAIQTHIEVHNVKFTLSPASKTNLVYDSRLHAYTLTIPGMDGVDTVTPLTQIGRRHTSRIKFSENFKSVSDANSVKGLWDAAIAELNKPGHP